jgi:hypothetical protein
MKKLNLFDVLIALLLILLVAEAYTLPNQKAKLSLFILAGAILLQLFRGRVPKNILAPTGIVYVIVSIGLYVLFIF